MGIVAIACGAKPRHLIVWLGIAAVTAIVAATRIYLGAHWFSDTLGGVFLGCGAVFVGAALLPDRNGRRPVRLLKIAGGTRSSPRHFTGHSAVVRDMSIPPYEPPKSAPSSGAANTLLCPKCAGVMKTYERNGIHLEQCDSCRGIFLDFGELESLTQMENRFIRPRRHRLPPPGLPTGLWRRPGLGTPRQQALPQAGLRQAVLLQLDHPLARCQ